VGGGPETRFCPTVPYVFGGNRRSDEAKKGCSPDTEVIDEGKFTYNTGKTGSPKNKLPVPTENSISVGIVRKTSGNPHVTDKT
jgi:hypothetical protein